MTSAEKVFQGVRDCLAAALDIPQETVHRDAKIIDDLGADSLDLLELTFLLEQRFKVKISPRDVERRTREKLADAPVEVDGVYTSEAVAELRKGMPEVPSEELAEGLTVAELPRRFRVATIVNLVCRLLDERESQCAEKGQQGAPADEPDGGETKEGSGG